MSKITTTIWEVESHTEAKHVILRKYLDAWLPILTTTHRKILYIDGFAGPGEYIGDKEGSPIIAIKSVIGHTTKNKFDIIMLFIEKDDKRFNFLKQKLSLLKLPSNIKCECFQGEFQEKMQEILDYLKQKNSLLAPAFVFIDPFGFTGIPLSIIKGIMKNPHCEVLITFMYDEINRFIKKKELWEHLKELFGTDEWKQILNENRPEVRLQFLHNLYKNQLKDKDEIKYVRSFLMKSDNNRPDYFLFFGTNNIRGLERMKEAMWKVDDSGSYKFSDATYNPSQTTLFEIQPDLTPLENELYKRAKGKKFRVQRIRDLTIEETAFLRKHCNQILRNWEKTTPSKIQRVCDDCRRSKICMRRSYGFNDDCIIKII